MGDVLPEGTVLGARYAIEAVLGEGAMGTVYRARHVAIGRTFAIKVLHRRLTANPKSLRRFEREAELAGRLRHPNVVSVVDVGETDGLKFIAMEYAPGEDLVALIREAPLPAERVLELARQLCDGLQHAHDAGLVHRDFKPENVIVESDPHGRDLVRIVDFGIAILRDDAGSETAVGRLTTAGIVVGTPHYMAPEQVRGQPLDHRADLFALGVILYELLTGRAPFEGTGVDVARANVTRRTPAMGVRVPTLEVDPVIEALVHKLLAKRPADRPASASAVRDLLDLIERDRRAAAAPLGLELPAPAPAPAPSAPLAPVSDEPELPVRRPARADRVDPDLGAPHRTGRLVAAPIAGLAVVALAWIGLRADSTTSSPVVALDAAIDEPTITARDDRGAHEDMPAIGDAGTPDAPSLVPTAPIAPMRPAAKPAPATVHTPDASELAALYSSVGRQLKALDATKGSDVTYDLWPRYRWVRINDALATADSRRAAAAILERLQREIRGR